MIAHHTRQLLSINELHRALFQFLRVFGVFKA